MLDLTTNEELSCVSFDHTPEVKNHVSVVMLINYALWCGKLKKKLNGSLVMSRRYWKMDKL